MGKQKSNLLDGHTGEFGYLAFCLKKPSPLISHKVPVYVFALHYSFQYVDIQTYKNQTIAASHLSDLPEGMCRLLLTNGQYHYVCLSSPGQYHRSVPLCAS